MQREMQVMVTPRVVQEVREHFGCEQLEGAELEDQGEDGTALTHWEKRVFEVKFMLISLMLVFHKRNILSCFLKIRFLNS